MTPEPDTKHPPGEASISTMHSLTVLETKLYKPKHRTGLVARSRLIERIRQGAEGPLTLVSAPAGFGKTTLLTEWLAQRPDSDLPVGWVSLGRSENDPALFWAYVLRALQKVHPGVGESALSLLQTSRHSPTESALTSLINEISSIDRDVILILDDFHVIDAPPVHRGLTFLLDHMPATMHIIIASRSEPLLPLARLRARGQVSEIPAIEMRFRQHEVTEYLNTAMALGLSAADVSTLETRTEGWIAGLKLAALSLKNHGDVQKFIKGFSGDNRYIADYLIQEVLLAQPENIRRFLLRTAILDRLNGPLCDAVTGESGSQALLESLERSNLFVVPLDDTRESYRYHHLFAEVLRAHFMREHAEQASDLHRRASSWFEDNTSLDDALHHAAAAGDVERVARLLEITWPEMDRSYHTGRWLERVKALPDGLVRARPVLNLGYAWTLLNAGELESVEARLDDVERLLRQSADNGNSLSTQMVLVDGKRFQFLSVGLASARAYLAQSLGKTAGTVEHARQTLALIPEGEHAARATGSAMLALAQWANGELDEAHRTFTASLNHMRLAGQLLSVVRGTFVLADIRVAQGRLNEAADIYEHGLQLAKDPAHTTAPETDELYLGLSELHRERGDVAAAARFLQTITGSDEHRGNRHRWCTAMARVAEARGDLKGALDLLVEAETVDVRTPIPRLRPVAALKARIWIAQGKLAAAKGWARDARLSIDDELSYLREFEHITLARLLVARNDDAFPLLERLLIAAAQGGRKGSLIEILVLEALAHQAKSDVRAAVDPLERALALAESEGYVMIFVDEGDKMRDLLRHVAARGIAAGYTRKLLRVFDGGPTPVADAPAVVSSERLLHDLTTRELEILRLIAAGMRNQEIADQLSISTATVKRHIANAYAKLDVSHRTEALVRAHALKLL
ncbi:MAG: regulatory protein LuxR [Gemmatimonadetes bacterium]|nr:regulatory protein LuxR [Gemmatimonadota bacterium]